MNIFLLCILDFKIFEMGSYSKTVNEDKKNNFLFQSQYFENNHTMQGIKKVVKYIRKNTTQRSY